MLGVAWVNKNRVAHPGWWGTTLIQVITHKWQFSGMTAPGDPNLVEWPQDVDAAFDNCKAAAAGVINGKFPDPTKGAVDYFSAPLTAPPVEWGPVKVTAVIDGLHFCAPVSA
jgi:spore germination cell wall hydrolase CwlJ-like protein